MGVSIPLFMVFTSACIIDPDVDGSRSNVTSFNFFTAAFPGVFFFDVTSPATVLLADAFAAAAFLSSAFRCLLFRISDFVIFFLLVDVFVVERLIVVTTTLLIAFLPGVAEPIPLVNFLHVANNMVSFARPMSVLQYSSPNNFQLAA